MRLLCNSWYFFVSSSCPWFTVRWKKWIQLSHQLFLAHFYTISLHTQQINSCLKLISERLLTCNLSGIHFLSVLPFVSVLSLTPWWRPTVQDNLTLWSPNHWPLLLDLNPRTTALPAQLDGCAGRADRRDYERSLANQSNNQFSNSCFPVREV